MDSFLLQQNVSALPGVGWAGAKKLEELRVKTIADLRACSAADVQRVLGTKSGEELINYAYGRDSREVRFALTAWPLPLFFQCFCIAAQQMMDARTCSLYNQ